MWQPNEWQGTINPRTRQTQIGFVLFLTYKSDIGMHRQVSQSEGRMGGVLGLPPSNTMTSSSISWIDIFFVEYTERQLHKVHVFVYWTSSLHNNYGNEEGCWIFVIENVQLKYIEWKEAKMTRTSKHEPDWGHWWISNHVCDCCKGSAFVEYKHGS